MRVRAHRSGSESAAEPGAEGGGRIDARRRRRLENPGDTPANVMLTHLVEGGSAPIPQPVVVAPFTRLTTFVNDVPGLSAAALSTVITSDVPIVAERAMYLNSTDRPWGQAPQAAGRSRRRRRGRSRKGPRDSSTPICCSGIPPAAKPP
jgi:hypothetical protein